MMVLCLWLIFRSDSAESAAYARYLVRKQRGLVNPATGVVASVGAVLALLGAFFAPLSILGWQGFTWLKFGYWPPVPVMALATGRPHMEWVGLQQLLDGFLDGCPLSLFLFFVFVGLANWLFSVAARWGK